MPTLPVIESIPTEMVLNQALPVIQAIIVVLGGWVLARWVKRRIVCAKARFIEPRIKPVLGFISFYGLLFLTFLSGLHVLGLNVTVLLGAAGVLTVATGFASQTAASNIISGIFLMVESPFSVGDIISVTGTTGEVVEIELLSTRIKTFENLYVRIPNETLLRSSVTNLTRFEKRRFDMVLEVSYKANLEAVTETLLAIAATNPKVLQEPAPLVLILDFAASGIKIQFSTWFKLADFIEVRNQLYKDIHRSFAEKAIEFSAPPPVVGTIVPLDSPARPA